MLYWHEQMKKTNSRNFTGMLGINAGMELLWLFVNVFLIAQVFFITDHDMVAVGLFLLLEVTTLFVFYAVASWVCKKIRAIWVVRLSVLLLCLFLLLAVIWADGLYSHFMLFGFIWGTAQGLYWGAMNFLLAKVFDKNRIVRYFVVIFVVAAVIGILFPFTFGLMLDFGNWVLTSGAVLAVAALQLACTFLVKTEMQADRQFRPIAYFRELKTANHLRPAISLWFVVFLAGTNHTITALLTFLIILVYGTNIGIGVMGSIFAAVGIATLLLYKTARPRAKAPLFLGASALPLIGVIPLFFYVAPITLILFNAALVLPRNIVNLEENSIRLNATRYWGGEQFLIESHLFYESALMVGRVLSCGALIVIGLVGVTQITLAAVIATTIALWTLHAITLFFWQRRHAK